MRYGVSAFFRISLPNKQKIMSLLRTVISFVLSFSRSLALHFVGRHNGFFYGHLSEYYIEIPPPSLPTTKTRSVRCFSTCGWFNMHEPQQMCKNLNEFISAFLSIVKSSQIIFSLVAHFFLVFHLQVCLLLCALFILFWNDLKIRILSGGIILICYQLFQFSIQFPLECEVSFCNKWKEKEYKITANSQLVIHFMNVKMHNIVWLHRWNESVHDCF